MFILYLIIYSNSSEFKAKLEIGNSSAADFDCRTLKSEIL